MKTHIALVGGQTLPVYSSIIHSKAERIILICSNSTKKEAERIASCLGKPCEIKIFDPIVLPEIFKQLDDLLHDIPEEDEVSLNLVSGTKFWSLSFYDTFRSRERTKFVLVDQNNNIWNYCSRSCEQLPPLATDMVFRLYGNPLTESKNFKQYTPDDDFVATQLMVIWEQFGEEDKYKALTTVLKKERNKKLQKKNKDLFEEDAFNKVEWNKTDGNVELSLSSEQHPFCSFILKSPNAVSLVFNTGWFEYYIAKVLSKWSPANDIRLNCYFPIITKKGKEQKNEVDLVINLGFKLIFVECKTGLSKPTDIDKFASVVKNYGGTGTKGIVVSLKWLSETAKNKCKDYSLLCFSLIEHGFNNNREMAERALINLLEREIGTTNK